MEQPSTRDILADARRDWRHWHNYAIGAGAIVFGIALFRLRDPEIAEATRTFWLLFPLPFFLLGLWATIARERRVDELTRTIERDADAFAMKFTTFLIPWLALFAIAGYTIDWPILLFPLLIRSLAWTMIRRRIGLP